MSDEDWTVSVVKWHKMCRWLFRNTKFWSLDENNKYFISFERELMEVSFLRLGATNPKKHEEIDSIALSFREMMEPTSDLRSALLWNLRIIKKFDSQFDFETYAYLLPPVGIHCAVLPLYNAREEIKKIYGNINSSKLSETTKFYVRFPMFGSGDSMPEELVDIILQNESNVNKTKADFVNTFNIAQKVSDNEFMELLWKKLCGQEKQYLINSKLSTEELHPIYIGKEKVFCLPQHLVPLHKKVNDFEQIFKLPSKILENPLGDCSKICALITKSVAEEPVQKAIAASSLDMVLELLHQAAHIISNLTANDPTQKSIQFINKVLYCIRALLCGTKHELLANDHMDNISNVHESLSSIFARALASQDKHLKEFPEDLVLKMMALKKYFNISDDYSDDILEKENVNNLQVESDEENEDIEMESINNGASNSSTGPACTENYELENNNHSSESPSLVNNGALVLENANSQLGNDLEIAEISVELPAHTTSPSSSICPVSTDNCKVEDNNRTCAPTSLINNGDLEDAEISVKLSMTANTTHPSSSTSPASAEMHKLEQNNHNHPSPSSDKGPLVKLAANDQDISSVHKDVTSETTRKIKLVEKDKDKESKELRVMLTPFDPKKALLKAPRLISSEVCKQWNFVSRKSAPYSASIIGSEKGTVIDMVKKKKFNSNENFDYGSQKNLNVSKKIVEQIIQGDKKTK